MVVSGGGDCCGSYNYNNISFSDCEPSSMICMPIMTKNDGTQQQVMGVAVVCDKVNGKQ